HAVRQAPARLLDPHPQLMPGCGGCIPGAVPAPPGRSCPAPGATGTEGRSKNDELPRPSRRLAAQGSSGTRQFSVSLRRAPKGPVSKGAENCLLLECKTVAYDIACNAS